MRYKLVLKVFAESEVTGESVELCPGGLVERHTSIDSLLTDIQAACEQGWATASAEELHEFYTRLEHEGDAATRIFRQREQAGAIGPPAEGKKPHQKGGSCCKRGNALSA